MGRTILHLSMSLDGFAAGLDTSPAHPLGKGGEILHRWMFGALGQDPSEEDKLQAESLIRDSGAFVMGRTMFDVGEPLWGPDGAWGRPCFVMTNRRHKAIRRGPTTFEFVTTGINSALERAKAAAGEADVAIVGGPTTARQFLSLGLVDEFRLHLVPVCIGDGIRLFDGSATGCGFIVRDVTASQLAVHLRLAHPARSFSAGL